MKIIIVHNEYAKYSGEEAAVGILASVLRKAGHDVVMFTKTSADIEHMQYGEAKAFFSGIYSVEARRQFSEFIRREKPDLVHVHNVFPLISPSILPECTKEHIPVVMTLHNYRLICPNALLLRNGNLCRECSGGHEWNAVRHNCEHSIPKSLGYALRTAFARYKRLFMDNVDAFICLTAFQRYQYLSEKYPADKLVVIPPCLPDGILGDIPPSDCRNGEFVLYAGRVSEERDVPTLLAAALQCQDIPFKIAGSYWRMPHLPKLAPPNVQFLGEVAPDELARLYQQSRFFVFPTCCYEGFPNVLLEAMAHSRPVLCTDIGGLREIVIEGTTGSFYKYGNPADLAERVKELWINPPLCNLLGKQGRARLESEYGEAQFRDRILALYGKVRGTI